jgi:polyferredoxin
VAQHLTRPQTLARLFRPRVLVYASILAAIVVAAAASLWLRVPLKVDVIRDRAAISREVEGGLVENVYRLQIMNTAEAERRFEVRAEGLPGIHVASEASIAVEAAASRMVPIRVRVPPGEARPGTHPIEFVVSAVGVDGVAVREKSVFIVR